MVSPYFLNRGSWGREGAGNFTELRIRGARDFNDLKSQGCGL